MSPLNNFLLKYLKPKDNVLDLGCGSDRELYFLENYRCNVIGIDVTPEFVNALKFENKDVYIFKLPE